MTITERTAYSGTVFWTIICVAVAGAVWATNVNGRLSNIESALQDGSQDRWRGGDQRAWAKQLQELNQTLKVPEVIPTGR